jgi:hypothetical protein
VDYPPPTLCKLNAPLAKWASVWMKLRTRLSFSLLRAARRLHRTCGVLVPLFPIDQRHRIGNLVGRSVGRRSLLLHVPSNQYGQQHAPASPCLHTQRRRLSTAARRIRPKENYCKIYIIMKFSVLPTTCWSVGWSVVCLLPPRSRTCFRPGDN